MPAILDTEEALDNWLNYGEVNAENALAHIKPVKLLLWHAVSTLVNNARNKDVSCNKPMKEE